MRSLLALVIVGCLFPATAQAADDKEETESQAVERFTRILNAKSKIDVIEEPLGRVCSDLSKRYGIPITLDPKGLAEVGASPKRIVNIKCDGIPLSTILNILLHPQKLTYHVTPTGLVITARPKPPK